MKTLFRPQRLAVPALVASALLAGCAAPAKPLYQWEGYQPQVYQYFKGGDRKSVV